MLRPSIRVKLSGALLAAAVLFGPSPAAQPANLRPLGGINEMRSWFNTNTSHVMWDTWMLFDRGATWKDNPDGLLSWDYTIMRTRGQLQEDLESITDTRREGLRHFA